MRDVIYAIISRELKTRFGEHRLGYIWLFLEPVSLLLVWMVVLGLVSKHIVPGVDFSVFMTTGLLPWLFISNSVNQCTTALESNVGLLSYRRVKPIDIIISRVVIEFVGMSGVACLLLIVGYAMGLRIALYDWLSFLMAISLVFLFAFSLALTVGVSTVLFPLSKKFVPVLLKPFYFISAIMYPLTIIPQQKQIYFTWNPVLNCIELIRTAWFGPIFHPVIQSWLYISMVVLCSLTFSLWFYRSNIKRLVIPV